ncbi:aspartate/glutamate racemase family protein [Dyella choica]|uniref:Aspartate/glutamate racemase family protein n=1 Tax=Dyella choica TaxID=1927959 RepID=A0A432M532_9GAMM|nr:aspartate/glutamate racemase family protein [Dyella choica]RUL74549.1 aspartate/glutamate racemase family protein [Dyella choica]
MKTLGLIGGISWESTVPYYRLINETVKTRLGGLHSAKLVLYSVDFEEVARLQHAGDWDAAGRLFADAARRLEAAGADAVVICANTMHKVAPAIEAAVRLPVLHVVDGVADEIRVAGLRKVGLLGTRFTMEQPFYAERLQQHGIEALIPGEPARTEIHRVIYQELCVGKIVDSSRVAFRNIMAELVAQGAEAIILACTELSLLLGPQDATVPLFDTTQIHARRAAEWAIG